MRKNSSSKYGVRAKLLYKYLKKNLCLREYERNVVNQHINSAVIEEYFKTNDILQLIRDFNHSIDNSFLWAKTPQGHDFWEKLEYNFERYFIEDWLRDLSVMNEKSSIKS